MATERLVVVGGDAAGMAAASQARRLRKPDELAITAFERGHFTSYSACGIPYWVGGDVDGPDALIARTAGEHRARDIDLRMRTEVTELDLDRGRVRTRELDNGGRETWTGFDKLVLATGARPRRPGLPGIDAPGVHGVQTLDDGQALLDTLDASSGRRAVVVGAGYIGVEMAEALIRRGYAVTVLEQSAQPMSTLDPDMGALVHEAMCGMGIETVCGTTVTGVLTDEGGRARAVTTEDGEYPADVVVLGLGVRPETTLAAAAGLPLGESGGQRLTLQQPRPRPGPHLGRRRLCGGPGPDLRAHPPYRAGHPRQQARPGHRRQCGRRLCHLPRCRRHGRQQGLRSGDRPDGAAGA
jgi:NADPH-dependent 2,4-dienoyl-CoA reductase/sulfur reductase-like enzyme